MLPSFIAATSRGIGEYGPTFLRHGTGIFPGAWGRSYKTTFNQRKPLDLLGYNSYSSKVEASCNRQNIKQKILALKEESQELHIRSVTNLHEAEGNNVRIVEIKEQLLLLKADLATTKGCSVCQCESLDEAAKKSDGIVMIVDQLLKQP